MLKLEIIIASTRPGRAGLPIGSWFYEVAKQDTRFDVALCDLAEINLPLYDEPRQPITKQYEHQHTKDWSARIAQADAFVMVLPEYNYSIPPAFVNAVDYLLHEWKYKPTAFVSYGGVSGGTRAVQMAKLLLTAVGIMPLPEAVTIPFFRQYLQEGVFTANDKLLNSVAPLMNELNKWGTALLELRSKQ